MEVGWLEEAHARVQVQGVTKSFRLSRERVFHALRGVSLEVADGETVVLLGPSGCGKTTLLRCVAGLDIPNEGEIFIGGRCVVSQRPRRFVPPEGRNVSMVFQSYALWPHMRVWENVAYPLQNRGRELREARRAAEETLELVGLGGFGDRYPGQLSGGQQQRVALARALVARADVVLLDEPLSSLDAPVREQLRLELRELKQRTRWTAVYVTHDQKEATFLADRIAVMDRGRIVQVGPPEEVFRRPSSAYVARFTGCVNRVRGRVDGSEGDRVLVRTSCGRIWGTWCGPGRAERDADVEAYWRPEQCSLRLDPDPRDGAALRGRVVSLAFVGAGVEYVLRGAGEPTVLWRALGDGVRHTDADVRLEVDARDLYVYPVERVEASGE